MTSMFEESSIETREVRAWRVYCSNGGTVQGISGYASFTIHLIIGRYPKLSLMSPTVLRPQQLVLTNEQYMVLAQVSRFIHVATSYYSIAQ